MQHSVQAVVRLLKDLAKGALRVTLSALPRNALDTLLDELALSLDRTTAAAVAAFACSAAWQLTRMSSRFRSMATTA